MHPHRCERWERHGLECPFSSMRGHEHEEDDDDNGNGPPFVGVPERRKDRPKVSSATQALATPLEHVYYGQAPVPVNGRKPAPAPFPAPAPRRAPVGVPTIAMGALVLAAGLMGIGPGMKGRGGGRGGGGGYSFQTKELWNPDSIYGFPRYWEREGDLASLTGLFGGSFQGIGSIGSYLGT